MILSRQKDNPPWGTREVELKTNFGNEFRREDTFAMLTF